MSIIISSGGAQDVQSGQTSRNVVLRGGVQYIEAGGAAIGTAISKGGFQVLSSGGHASNTTVFSGGIDEILGGTADGITVSNGGRVTVFAPASVSDLSVLSGGSAVLLSGHYKTPVVRKGGSLTVHSSVVTGTIVDGGTETVEYGSIDSGGTVMAGGTEILANGGKAVGGKIMSGGTLIFSSGVGAVTSMSIASGESVLLYASATGLTVGKGVSLFVADGGSVKNVTVNGGTATFDYGAQITGTVHVAADATLSVSDQERLAVVGFAAGDRIDLPEIPLNGQAGDLLGDVTLTFVENAAKTAGKLTVADDDYTVSLTLSGNYAASGFRMDFDSSGVATEITYTAPAPTRTISSGQTVSSASIVSGHPETVLSGGVSFDANVAGGSLILAGGSALSGTVEGGGRVDVGAGGHMNGMHIFSGSAYVSSGGNASGVDVYDSGQIEVENGGHLYSAGVYAGFIIVDSGGIASKTVIASHFFIDGGMFIDTGGKAVDTVLARGTLFVDGRDSGTKVSDLGTINVEGGVDIGATISGGGSMDITGGSVRGTTVSSGGYIGLEFGSASDLTILSGGIVNDYRGHLKSVTVAGGGQIRLDSRSTASGVTIGSGAFIAVSSGATVSGITVSSGGIVLKDGGTVSGITAAAGATIIEEVVSSGVTASGRIVSNGQLQEVHSGGKAVGTTVLSGGRFFFNGGAVSGLSVKSGGYEAVDSKVTLNNAVISKGVDFEVMSGGTLTGTTKMANDASLYVHLYSAPPGSLTISGFNATDTLYFGGPDTSAKLSFVENAGKTQGTLTLTEGGYHATVILFGQYVAAGFHLADDGKPFAGVALTYEPTAHSAQPTVAPRH